MSLPTLTKTWEISANNSYVAQGSTIAAYRNFWLNFVTWLKQKGWSVRAASNATTASTSIDWTTTSNLNWWDVAGQGIPAKAHSWIVLRNSSVSSTFDLCIELGWKDNYGSQNGWGAGFGMFISPGGYNVGGTLSTTARPSATSSDEITLNDNLFWSPGSIWGNGDSSVTWHGWSSTDRECTRAMIYAGDNLVGIFMIDKVNEPSTNWSNPFYALFRTGGGGGVSTQTAWSSSIMNTRIGSTNTSMFISCDSITGQASLLSGQPNDISREYPVLPLGLVSATAPVRGHHGYIYDAWWSFGAHGTFFPNTTDKSFSLHGGMVLPWNGTSFVKTR